MAVAAATAVAHAFGPVHGGRELVRVAEFAFGTMHAADALADLAHALGQHLLHRRVVAARVALDDDVRRNCIADAVGDELGARNHRLRARVERARNDALQRQHDLRADDDRVNAHVRPRRMRAAALHVDHEVVFARHEAARARGDGAGAHAGHVVQAVDLVDRKAIEQAVVHHRLRAAAMLLCRLEDEAHGAVEILPLAQQLRRAEDDRHVAVVAAGVHLAGRAEA